MNNRPNSLAQLVGAEELPTVQKSRMMDYRGLDADQALALKAGELADAMIAEDKQHEKGGEG